MNLISMRGNKVLFNREIGSESDIFFEHLHKRFQGPRSLEDILAVSFDALGNRGYAAPRLYLSRGNDCFFLQGKDLPQEIQRRRVKSLFLQDIVRQRAVYVNEDCRDDRRLFIDNDPLYHVAERGLIVTPFTILPELSGVLAASYSFPMLLDEIKLFYRLAQDVGIMISQELERTKVSNTISELHRQIEDLKRRDNATGLCHKQSLHRDLKEYFSEVQQGQTNYYLVLMDIDNLKPFNLQFGHAAGDEFVRQVGEYISCIPSTVAYRAGGDKFALVTKANRGDFYILKLVRTLKEGIRQIPVPERSVPLTASFGLSLSDREMADSEQWYAIADEALREAKVDRNKGVYLERGRSQAVRVCV